VDDGWDYGLDGEATTDQKIQEYGRVQTLKREIRVAKQNWTREKCTELENLISKHDV